MPLCVNVICSCRLDDVCLSLAVMPDRTVFVVYRLIFSLSFLISPNQTVKSYQFSEILLLKNKIRPFCEKFNLLKVRKKSKTFSPSSGNHGSIFMLPASPNQSCVACLCLTRREWKIRFIMCASIQCEMEREGITQTSPAHNCACNVEA